MVSISNAALSFINYLPHAITIDGIEYEPQPIKGSLRPRENIILIVPDSVFAMNPRKDLAIFRDGELITR